MEDRLVIETPEQVELSYELAGLGSRFAAGVVDFLLVLFVIVLLVLALFVIHGVATPGSGDFVGVDEEGVPRFGLKIVSWATALVALLIFAVYWGYFFFETVTNGRTPAR